MRSSRRASSRFSPSGTAASFPPRTSSATAADRFWSAGRWDRTQVPKPFARVGLAIGEPMIVPDTADDTVERCRVELEARLAALETRARQLSNGSQEIERSGDNRRRTGE